MMARGVPNEEDVVLDQGRGVAKRQEKHTNMGKEGVPMRTKMGLDLVNNVPNKGISEKLNWRGSRVRELGSTATDFHPFGTLGSPWLM